MRKKIFIVGLLIVLCFTLCSCDVIPLYESGTLTKENVYSVLNNIKIIPKTSELVKGELPNTEVKTENGSDSAMFMFELPDISNYDPEVKGSGDVDVEIFIPLEDNGSAIREVVSNAAKLFNESNNTLADGRTVSVTIRSLEASLAEEYIVNGVYYPKGYVASNELYGVLMKENGINASLVTNRTVGNTMGIVFTKSKYDELVKKYGEVTIATLVKANEVGDVSVGYTNPTNNPTGLNFVISMLSYFDANNPASMEATTDFSNFQNTVATVSYSTEQMKQIVSSGVIDAFIFERQAFEKDTSMKNDFVFMPFGVRHDNPLYAIGNVSAEESEVLAMFSNFISSEDIQNYAASFGFNQDNEYVSTVGNYSGGTISNILSFWKEEKSSGKKIVTVFVADKSGSMAGNKLTALKNSLKTAMQYVGENNKVGLISYSETVYIDLPIKDFTREHQEYYVGAIDNWRANGGTATNNALLVAAKLLLEEQAIDPNIKPIIILLSDGYTQSGYSLSSVAEILDVVDIPIYTIGYEANVSELESIARINQGAFINATSDDIGYILKTLFDAEM